jgi:hypothetical protein
MNDTNELTRQRWSNCLWQALASQGKNEAELKTISNRFDALTDTEMSPENAFQIIFEAAGGVNARDVLNQAARFIHDELDSMTKFAPKIKTNSTTRFADLLKRYNRNLNNCAGLSVNGVGLDEEEIKKLHIPVAPFDTIVATASDKSAKVKSLTLEITK